MYYLQSVATFATESRKNNRRRVCNPIICTHHNQHQHATRDVDCWSILSVMYSSRSRFGDWVVVGVVISDAWSMWGETRLAFGGQTTDYCHAHSHRWSNNCHHCWVIAGVCRGLIEWNRETVWMCKRVLGVSWMSSVYPLDCVVVVVVIVPCRNIRSQHYSIMVYSFIHEIINNSNRRIL